MVPHKESVCEKLLGKYSMMVSLSLQKFVKPKSVILGSKWWSSKMFALFKSPCTILCECKKPKPVAMPRAMLNLWFLG